MKNLLAAENAPIFILVLAGVVVACIGQYRQNVRAAARENENRLVLSEPVKPYAQISQPKYLPRNTKVEFKLAKNQVRRPGLYDRQPAAQTRQRSSEIK